MALYFGIYLCRPGENHLSMLTQHFRLVYRIAVLDVLALCFLEARSEQWKRAPGCLEYIGDEIPRSYLLIIINHSKESLFKNQPVFQWNPHPGLVGFFDGWTVEPPTPGRLFNSTQWSQSLEVNWSYTVPLQVVWKRPRRRRGGCPGVPKMPVLWRGEGGGSGVRSYGLIIFVFHLVSGGRYFFWSQIPGQNLLSHTYSAWSDVLTVELQSKRSSGSFRVQKAPKHGICFWK